MSTTINPTALYQITGEHLLQIIEGAAEMVLSKLQTDNSVAPLMCSRQVRNHLQKNGFRVKSSASFQSIIKTLGLVEHRELKGKEYWYKSDQVLAVGSRLNNK